MKAGEALPRLTVDVTARTVIMGAVASRDWQPQHHDHRWAVERAGTRDIFLNTPNQAGWIERYLTDWTGPQGRLGRLKFKMRKPVCPGDTLHFDGVVSEIFRDDQGTEWAQIEVTLRVGDEVATVSSALISTWPRATDDWSPPAWT